MTALQALAELVALLTEAETTLSMWADVAPAVSLRANIQTKVAAARAVLAQGEWQIRCEKCAESMAKCAEVVAQTHLAGLRGHTKSAACIHREDDPKGCYRVRCQLGNECAAAKEPT